MYYLRLYERLQRFLKVIMVLDLILQHLKLREYLQLRLHCVYEHHSRVVVDKRHNVFGPNIDIGYIGSITSP